MLSLKRSGQFESSVSLQFSLPSELPYHGIYGVSYLSERLLQSLLNRNIQLSVESDAGLDRLSISFLRLVEKNRASSAIIQMQKILNSIAS